MSHGAGIGFTRILIRLYPRAWRDRYGDEFAALLAADETDARIVADVVLSALRERLTPTMEVTMEARSGTTFALARKPSAVVPLAMSLTALAVVLGHVAIYGVVHEADEGAAAHIWQLLIAGHLPVAAYFSIKWLPKARREALVVLGLLAVSMLANFAAVYFLT